MNVADVPRRNLTKQRVSEVSVYWPVIGKFLLIVSRVYIEQSNFVNVNMYRFFCEGLLTLFPSTSSDPEKMTRLK